MTTRLHLSCGGCDAQAHSEPIRVFHGNPVNLEAVAPDGWIVSDPWTRCTYCPACWQGIIGETKDDPPTTGQPKTDTATL